MSGASTMRNAIKRITHKERAQPSDRKRFGLLEKHKDYVVRSKDYKNKQNTLKGLRNKALERNPDEFYFGMHNSRVIDGKHREIKKNVLSQEVLNDMKTKDMGYIVYKKEKLNKKIEKLKNNMHLIGENKPKSHTIFVDNEEELEEFDAAEHFGTAPELLERVHNIPRLSDLEKQLEENNGKIPAALLDNQSKKRSHEMRELKESIKSSKKFTEALFDLSKERNLATSKGKRKKIVLKQEIGKGPNKKTKDIVVFKWKRERKR